MTTKAYGVKPSPTGTGFIIPGDPDGRTFPTLLSAMRAAGEMTAATMAIKRQSQATYTDANGIERRMKRGRKSAR